MNITDLTGKKIRVTWVDMFGDRASCMIGPVESIEVIEEPIPEEPKDAIVITLEKPKEGRTRSRYRRHGSGWLRESFGEFVSWEELVRDARSEGWEIHVEVTNKVVFK